MSDVGTRLVQTDMGNSGAKAFGFEEAPVTIKDSVNGMIAQVSQMHLCVKVVSLT
jgi:hypothetical protein